MGTTRASSIGRHQLVSGDLPGPGVDLGERAEVVGHRVGDPGVPVVIDDRVVHPPASVHARGNAGRPVAAVEVRPLVLELGDRDVVLGHHMASRVTGRARLELERQRGRLRPPCLSQVFGQLVFVVLDRERRPTVRPTPTVVAHPSHQVDDRPPAALIESVLQRQAGLVAFRAGDPKQLFESAILACVGRQGIQPLDAGQLVGEVVDGGEGEVLRRRLRGGQSHFGASPLVTDRLRPHLVRASFERWRERRKEVLALLVGEDRRGYRLARGTRRDGDALHPLTGDRRDRPRQRRPGVLGGLRGRRRRTSHKVQNAETDERPRQPHDSSGLEHCCFLR